MHDGGRTVLGRPVGRIAARVILYGALAAVVVFAGRSLGGGSDEGRQTASFGQESPPPPEAQQRRFEVLMRTLGIRAGPVVNPTGSVLELRVTIRSGAGVGAPAAARTLPEPTAVVLTARKARPGALSADRAQEVALSQLLIVGVDRSGQARWSGLMPDPSVLRAEFPDQDGRLSGQVLERPSAEALVAVPNHPEISEVRLYRPRAGAERSVVELLGSIPVA